MTYLPLVIGMTLANFSLQFFSKKKNYGKAMEISLHQILAVGVIWIMNTPSAAAFVEWLSNFLAGCNHG
jgi:hypothetical protein